MKSIQTLKWLTLLTGERLIRALLMMGISTTFTMYLISQNELKNVRNQLFSLNEDRRIEERQRTDSFNLVIKVITDEYTHRYERYLEEQLDKIEETNKIVTRNISKNSKLIKEINAK